METLFEKENNLEPDIYKESDTDEETDNNWNINYNKEKIFQDNIVLKYLLYLLHYCPNCKKILLKYTKKKPDILNPYYLKCNDAKCRKKSNIRECSFLKFAKMIPATIVYEVILLFIIEQKNGKDIELVLKNKYDKIPNYRRILFILENIRKIIVEYLKYNYKLK